MTHVHDWIFDVARNRFRCACGVYGYRPLQLPGQLRAAFVPVVAYVCRHRPHRGGPLCGAEATHVSGEKQASRCGAHAAAKVVAA